MRPVQRLLPALAVTAVLLVGTAACGGDSGPAAEPATTATPSPTEAAGDPLLTAVVSLQKLSADFGASFATLEQSARELEENARKVELGETTEKELTDLATAYDGDRTAYLDAIRAVGEQSVGAGPAIEAAYAAFEPDARGTVQHADDVLNYRISATSCSTAARISPMSADAAVRTARTCQEAVAYFQDSDVPELRAYGRGYDRLMDRRVKIFGGVTSAGDSPDDTVDLLGDMTTALEQTTRAFADFKPTLDAVPDALDAQIEAVRLTETYPALLALVEARSTPSAGSSD